MTEPKTPQSDDVAKIEVEDAIDLHGFQPKEIRSVVESYLEEAFRAGFEEVRLIHGRGKGIQRAAIWKLLETHPLVMGFVGAPAHRGGWGATVVTFIDPAVTEDP